MRKFLASIWEVAEVVLIAVITVFVIRSYLAQPFLVSGASMEPNFSHGNYLLVDELTYRFREPERGEVVVFRSPQDEKTFFIKRIIGLPGEHVVVKSGKVEVFDPGGNPVSLAEGYILGDFTAGSFDETLGPDEFLVLGDNRNNSFDSRNWGALTRGAIIGIVRIRLFPLNRIGLIEAPAY